MPTPEQYEQGATNLAREIRAAPGLERKSQLMTYLGNLRCHQYRSTKEPRARKLAGNCYITARYLELKATTA